MELQEFKKIIEKNLFEFLDYKINSLPLNNKDLKNIFDQLLELSKDGKRIRPYIAYLAYKTSGGTQEKEAIKFFTFIEIFHLFCLVHDDIMDKAEKRHKIQTIHKFAAFQTNEHYGNSQAILVGDLLLSWSFEFLLNSDFNQNQIKNVQNIFFQMIDEVCLGQMLDLNITTKKTATDEEIIQKMLLKTAGYSFTKPLLIGAALAGKNDDAFYTKFGTYLGTTFQIQDDLIDIDGNGLDKNLFNDISEHQHTLFTNYVFEKGTKEQKEVLRELFGKNLTEDDKEKLRIIFKEGGSLDYGKEIIKSNIENAKKLITESSNPNYKIFLELINIIEKRKN